MIPVPDIKDSELYFTGTERIESQLIPPQKDIPDEFWKNDIKERRLFDKLFFSGGDFDYFVTPREGVDKKKAIKALFAVMATRSIGHEHKEAAWAYLCREWFSEIKLEK